VIERLTSRAAAPGSPAAAPPATLDRIRAALGDIRSAIAGAGLPSRALHGDASRSNLLRTSAGLLWTDFEDSCRGPVEWDLACLALSAGADAGEALDAYGRCPRALPGGPPASGRRLDGPPRRAPSGVVRAGGGPSQPLGGGHVRRTAILALTGALAAAGCGGGDDRPSREEARRCLEGLDLHVTGAERSPEDRAARATSPRSGETPAPSTAPSERYGTLTLLWVRGHEGRFADRTRDCLL
jgi:hypothetical protein